MPHKHKLAEFEKLLLSIGSGEGVDAKELEDYGLDESDMARLKAAIAASKQLPATKPNNNNFPQEYLDIIRTMSAPKQTTQKPAQLFSFDDAVKNLRRPKKDAEAAKPSKAVLDMS